VSKPYERGPGQWAREWELDAGTERRKRIDRAVERGQAVEDPADAALAA
jgi:hypothetical protein